MESILSEDQAEKAAAEKATKKRAPLSEASRQKKNAYMREYQRQRQFDPEVKEKQRQYREKLKEKKKTILNTVRSAWSMSGNMQKSGMVREKRNLKSPLMMLMIALMLILTVTAYIMTRQ